ncbi:MAG: MBL fold metallo-hydrolase [Hyphomicrobium sp.]|jgi:ribonuclease BN (tRNA processing enzyme)
MKLTVVGSSDAFGSGGRLQTCFHVAHARGQFLVDCGATSLIGLFRQDLNPNAITQIFITHLHGDHFSGLAWWLIHAVHVARRTTPLTIAGPAGIEERFNTVAEALFPGSTKVPRVFDLQFLEYRTENVLEAGDVRVVPYEVSHPSGATPYALRIETGGKVLSYSGDTEWVETLVPAASGSDLMICECSAFEARANFHLNWRTIEKNIDRLAARRVLLTHLGPEALANLDQIRHPLVTLAEDGLRLDI